MQAFMVARFPCISSIYPKLPDTSCHILRRVLEERLLEKYNSPRKSGAVLDEAPPTRHCLHRLESLVHRNLAAAQNWAALGLLDRLAQRVSLDNRVPGGQRPHRAITDLSVARDVFGLRGKRIAPVYQGTTELTKPGPPRLHDRRLFSFSLGHAAAAIE